MVHSVVVRFVIAIALVAGAVAYVGLPHVDRVANAWLRMDAESRAQEVLDRIRAQLPNDERRSDAAWLTGYLDELRATEHVDAIVLCRHDGTALAATRDPLPSAACAQNNGAAPIVSQVAQSATGKLHIATFDVVLGALGPVRVLIAHDLHLGDDRRAVARDYLVAFAVVAAIACALLIAMTAWWLLQRWVSTLVTDIRSGRLLDNATTPRFSVPILAQVRRALEEAEARQRLELDYLENWTPLALQDVVRDPLRAEQIVVVSNRQPYSHVTGNDGSVRVQIPASGMVTALEPITRACAGVWIAHGSGDADRGVVDGHDRIRVPPDDPSYLLRRVWLSPEEEEGYYFGFANEGLWALCHLAFVRPQFRPTDWQIYQAVNRKFASVVAAEATCERPVVLIQDFHFSLLPALIRNRLPDATVVLFWHVPWPNAETFGICPWKVPILTHMLRSNILGFHTRYHCQNFLATVDRFVECQIDHERMTVTSQGHVCQIASYPISIEWPPRWTERAPPVDEARVAVRRAFGICDAVKLGVGVERWDFTKGIVERFLAVETFFERNPQAVGKVTLLQIAAPSRDRLPAYQALQRRTLEEAERINVRFGTATWKPIVLVCEHEPPAGVFELFRAADFCLVTSLHDGMNLVAKEFVGARDDEDGVLILSAFAGAARELSEALLVNPFDIGETARAIEAALDMSREERRQRMHLMRSTVKHNNVYRWAGQMLMDAARIRQREELREATSVALQPV